MRAKESQRKLPTWAYPGAGYVRKEPCNFGWDWGPTLITCGIWRKIGIVAFDTCPNRRCRHPAGPFPKGHGQAHRRVTARPATSAGARGKGPSPPGGDRCRWNCRSKRMARQGRDLHVSTNPKFWWPAGMGGQPLYRVDVELARRRRQAAGLARPSALACGRCAPCSKPAAMPLHFAVNGVPFFAKGANWIPADCFPNRLTQDILRRYVDDAAAANMNTPAVLGRRLLRGRRLVRPAATNGAFASGWISSSPARPIRPSTRPFWRTSRRKPATTSPACGTTRRSPSGAATTKSCSSAAGRMDRPTR